MGRYDPPDPLCKHAPKVRVSSQPAGEFDPAGPLASTYCCSREACLEDAKEWVQAVTHQDAVHVIDLPGRKS